jgi:hypothetical protein
MTLLLANVVWPALYLSMRLSAWWCIGISLFLEGVALWRFARLRPVKAFMAAAVMNGVSTLCGSLLIPIAGLRLELVAGHTYNTWFGWGTFNVVTQVATWLIAVLLTTAIELVVLWLAFCMPWTKRTTLVVLSANAITVALAFVTMFISPPQ